MLLGYNVLKPLDPPVDDYLGIGILKSMKLSKANEAVLHFEH
jgi:hypothetical protein